MLSKIHHNKIKIINKNKYDKRIRFIFIYLTINLYLNKY